MCRYSFPTGGAGTVGAGGNDGGESRRSFPRADRVSGDSGFVIQNSETSHRRIAPVLVLVPCSVRSISPWKDRIHDRHSVCDVDMPSH